MIARSKLLHRDERRLGERMIRNVILMAAAITISIALGGCAGNLEQANQAEAAAQRAQQSAAHAEEAAAEALLASQQATEASERAEKSVEEATREINAVADRMERRQARAARKPHKKKIASAHGPSPHASPASAPVGATAPAAPAPVATAAGAH